MDCGEHCASRLGYNNVMRTPTSAALLVVPIAVLGVALSRAGVAIPATQAKSTGSVTYASGAAQYLADPHTLQLSHGVQFGQDDAALKTDAAVALFDKDNNVLSAKAAGPVHLYDPQDDLVGLHGSVDFTKHIATLRDQIVLVVKPGKREASAGGNSPRRQFKDPATLTCQMMTYDYKHKIGRIPGPLTVTQVIQTKEDGQQTRTLTAEAGLYDGRAQTIKLLGTVRGTYSDGSVIEGDTRVNGEPVVIHTKEGAEAISVPFPSKGHFTTKNQPDNSKDDGSDEPDLTLPAVPPRTPGPNDAPAAGTAPVPLAAPQAVPAQTPPPQAAPAGSP